MSGSRCVTVLAMLLIGVTAASADELQFSDPDSVIWWTPAGPNSGVYVSPYTGYDATTQETLSLFCDDYNTDFSGNPTWDATIYSLSPSTVSDYKYGSLTNAYTLYLEAAYLFSQAKNAQLASDTTNQIVDDIAAWSLFVNSANSADFSANVSDSGYSQDVVNAVTGASNAVDGGTFTGAGWYVATAQPGGGTYPMQEFLFDAPESVPDSGTTIALFGSVLGLLGLTRLRRRA
jgi:hypothetical protein